MKEKVNYKQYLVKAAVVFLLILVVVTFFSNTIKNSILPKVRVTRPVEGTLNRAISVYEYKVTDFDLSYIVSEGNWTVNEVFVKDGDKLNEGDLLFSIDTERYKTELLRLLAAARSLDNAVNNPYLSESDRRVLELQSYAAWRDYRMLRDSFPSSGEVLSTVSGEIKKVNIEQYDVLQAGQKIIEFIESEAKPALQFELSFAEHRVYENIDTAVVHIDNNGKTVKEKCPILKREEHEGGYTYYIDIPETVIHSDMIQYIELIKKSAHYDKLIPTECIKHDPVYGDYVFTVTDEKKRQTIVSIIRRVPVTIVDEYGLYSAVEVDTGKFSRIVQFTTGPIDDGDTVIVL